MRKWSFAKVEYFHVNTNPTPRGEKKPRGLKFSSSDLSRIFHWPRLWKRNEITDAKVSTEGWREHYEADVRTCTQCLQTSESPGGQSVAQSQAGRNGREWTCSKAFSCAHVAGEWLPRPETITPTDFHGCSSLSSTSFPVYYSPFQHNKASFEFTGNRQRKINFCFQGFVYLCQIHI